MQDLDFACCHREDSAAMTMHLGLCWLCQGGRRRKTVSGAAEECITTTLATLVQVPIHDRMELENGIEKLVTFL